jgi:hypothetical protein
MNFSFSMERCFRRCQRQFFLGYLSADESIYGDEEIESDEMQTESA